MFSKGNVFMLLIPLTPESKEEAYNLFKKDWKTVSPYFDFSDSESDFSDFGSDFSDFGFDFSDFGSDFSNFG